MDPQELNYGFHGNVWLCRLFSVDLKKKISFNRSVKHHNVKKEIHRIEQQMLEGLISANIEGSKKQKIP